MTSPITSYTPTAWVNGSLGGTPVSSDNLNHIETGVANAFALINSLRVSPTAIKTGTYNPAIGDFAIYQASTANITNTLPTSTPGAVIKIKKIDATAFTVIFNCAGAQTIDGNATSLTLRLQNETRTLFGYAGGWYVIDGMNSLSSLDGRYITQAAGDVRYTQQGPYYLGYKTAAQSIPNAFSTEPFTPITFENEDYDTHNGHSTSTNPSRFVVPVGWAGLYQVTSTVIFNAGGTSQTRRIAAHARNGARVRMGQVGSVSNNPDVSLNITSFVVCAENDYLETTCFQDSGAAINTFAPSSAGPPTTSMFVRYLRPV